MKIPAARSLCALLLLAVWHLCQAASLPVPTIEEHKAFLYGDWRPNRPSAILFIDPLCPYCKQAISKLGSVQHYNLFVFWSPIFGERSLQTIAPFFACAEPTAKPILDGLVVNSNAPPAACLPNKDASLRKRNDAIVAAYNIQSVPSYFLQGRLTSLAQLQQAPQVELPARVLGVAVPWSRYQGAQVLPGDAGESAAIVFPRDIPISEMRKAVDRFKPRYVFAAGNWEQFCQYIALRGCQTRGPVISYYDEIVALLGLAAKPGHTLVITMLGTIESN